MGRKGILWLMGMILAMTCACAQAESGALRAEEMLNWTQQVIQTAEQNIPEGTPAQEEAEDGYAFQLDFGVVYADQSEWTMDIRKNAMLVMDAEVAGPRGIAVDWEVNQVMATIPCENEAMRGNPSQAVLYLDGSPETGFRYGLVERDGQRIIAMEYGETDPAAERRIALVCGINGDGVDSLLVEGLETRFSLEEAKTLYEELDSLTRQTSYARVPRSRVGTELAPFQETDLIFDEINFLEAKPEQLSGENTEELMMDNEDGTWLRRIDGDGFEAVFLCDGEGRNAQLVSYAILSPEREGPRCVRLGDLFHEDFTRFRSGEGALSETGETEVLYGTAGKAPWGIAEYGNGSEMTLRYATPINEGAAVELVLRYQDTVLTEIIVHSLEEDEADAN